MKDRQGYFKCLDSCKFNGGDCEEQAKGVIKYPVFIDNIEERKKKGEEWAKKIFRNFFKQVQDIKVNIPGLFHELDKQKPHVMQLSTTINCNYDDKHEVQHCLHSQLLNVFYHKVQPQQYTTSHQGILKYLPTVFPSKSRFISRSKLLLALLYLKIRGFGKTGRNQDCYVDGQDCVEYQLNQYRRWPQESEEVDGCEQGKWRRDGSYKCVHIIQTNKELGLDLNNIQVVMKLNIKNLKGEVFQVDVEPADTVTVLKTKIQEVKGMPAETLKVVFKGKTLNNDDSIEKIGIKDTDFVVCMNQVAKPAPKPKEQTKVEPPKEEKKEEKKQEKKPQQSEAKQSPPQNQEHEAQINELMSMGFPRQQCQAALRAAFYNTQRAVEYLCNGIPPGLEAVANQPSSQAQGQGSGSGELGVAQLRALFNHPHFAQLRDVLRANPAAIQPILAQIGQTSPQLYNLIVQHPEEFERLITGDDQEGGQQGEGEGQGQGQAPPGTILISAADQQAINRLRQLGFSKIEAAQAYFACDKNEDLAANLLFDRLANGDIEMEPQAPQGSGQGGQGGSGGSGQGGPGAQDEDDDNLFN